MHCIRRTLGLLVVLLLGGATTVGIAWACGLRTPPDVDDALVWLDDDRWTVHVTGVPGAAWYAARADPKGTAFPSSSPTWMGLPAEPADDDVQCGAGFGLPMRCLRYRERRAIDAVLPVGGIVGRFVPPDWMTDWDGLSVLPVEPVPVAAAVDVLVWSLAWFLLLRAPAVVGAVRIRIRRWRRRCPACGYPVPADAACTECGVEPRAHRVRWVSTRSTVVGAFILVPVVILEAVFVWAFVEGSPYTPLHRAAARGDLAAARRLLESGADPNAAPATQTIIEPYHLHSMGAPLHLAATAGHADLVRLLVESGADPDRLMPPLFSTPLHASNESPDPSVASLLVTLGANPDARDAMFVSPIVDAAYRRKPDHVEAIFRSIDPATANGSFLADVVVAVAMVDRLDLLEEVLATGRGDVRMIDRVMSRPDMVPFLDGLRAARRLIIGRRGD